MVDLTANTPCAGLLPLSHGELSLKERNYGAVWSVAPFNGASRDVSAALKKAIGAGLPGDGRLLAGKSGEVFWTGQGQYFVRALKLPKLPAALSDQSDAWACVGLEGGGAIDVLARLCPLNLRSMDEGDVARSLIGHMQAIIIMRSDGIDLMVFRSMAATLVHELERVMRSVTAQRAL